MAIWPGKADAESPPHATGHWTARDLLALAEGTAFAEARLPGQGPGKELVPVPEASRERAKLVLAVAQEYERASHCARAQLDMVKDERKRHAARVLELELKIADAATVSTVDLQLKTKLLVALAKGGAKFGSVAGFSALCTSLEKELED